METSFYTQKAVSCQKTLTFFFPTSRQFKTEASFSFTFIGIVFEWLNIYYILRISN